MKNHILILLVVALLTGCSGFTASEKSVSIGLKKEGKIYFKSISPKEIIAQGKTPSIMPFNSVVYQNNEIYIRPDRLNQIIPILSNEISIVEKEELNGDGYFDVSGFSDAFKIENIVQNTMKAGQQRRSNQVTLTNSLGDTYVIKWENQDKAKAIENCEIRRITVVHQAVPGETVYNNEKKVFVKLQDILIFFGTNWSYEYNEEDEILYLIQ